MDKYDFSVGDKVVCVRAINCNSSMKEGWVYEVVSVTKHGDGSCSLGIKDGKNKISVWSSDRFIPVGEAKAGLSSFMKEENDLPKALQKYEQQFTADQKVVFNALGGVKFDQGKIDYTYLLKDLPVSVEEVTKVLMYGAKKYNRSNYSKVESERYEAAALRHIMAYLQGEQLDPETGYHHLAHAVCCLMFLVEREVKVNK